MLDVGRFVHQERRPLHVHARHQQEAGELAQRLERVEAQHAGFPAATKLHLHQLQSLGRRHPLRNLPHAFHLLLVLILAEPDKIVSLLSFESQIPILSQLLQFISSILRIVSAFLGFLLLFHKRFFSLVNLIYVSFALYYLQTGYKSIENPRLKRQVKLVINGIWVARSVALKYGPTVL